MMILKKKTVNSLDLKKYSSNSSYTNREIIKFSTEGRCCFCYTTLVTQSFNFTSICEKNLNPQVPPVHTAMKKFKDAAFCLQLYLLSALISHKNGAFEKRSSNCRKQLKALASVLVWTKKKIENRAIQTS